MNSPIRHITLCLVLLVGTVAAAQQLPQLSQYQFNDYVINPAVAGSRPFFEFRSGHRYQWVGITDAPRTFVFSTSTPIAPNMGVGGYLYTDHVGPTRRSGVQLSYAYHLQLTATTKLGLALSGGLLQYEVDGSKIEFHDAGDPVIDDQLRRDITPDAKFGLYLYSEKYWFGLTAPQLLQNDISFLDRSTETLSKLEDHYYASAGYKYEINPDWELMPSVLLKYVDPVPLKIDASLIVTYKDAIWIGGTWRSEDAIAAMVGVELGNAFQFGYSYDMTTTNLNNYSNGTHEVMLGIKIGKSHVMRKKDDPQKRQVEDPGSTDVK
jgi:type IX secretion system PorP/SprF family membrane protein